MINGLGWISIILSVVLGALIRLLLFPLMVLGFMKFSTFEIISIPLSMVPFVTGVIGLRRGNTRMVPLIGVTLGFALLLWLIVLNFVTIHIQGLG